MKLDVRRRFALGLCAWAACDPGATNYLGTRRIPAQNPSDAATEASVPASRDDEEQESDDEREARSCPDGGCIPSETELRCDGSSHGECRSCTTDLECEDDQRCDRASSRCVDVR